METRPTSGSNEALEQGIEKGGGGERFQNTPSLICILPSSLKERDIENNTFNSYANK